MSERRDRERERYTDRETDRQRQNMMFKLGIVFSSEP